MLKLDPNQKSYTMKMEDLFTTIENIVAYPNFSVTSQDKQRAAKIFLALQDYVSNHVEGQEGFGHFVMSEPALDFDTYVESIFDEKELDEIHRMG